MNLHEFEKTIKKLFSSKLLEEHDDFGFTNTSNDNINKIGYATNLSLETIEQASQLGIDLIVTHHDAWDFLYGLREECVKKMQEHNISHFWIHSPLDFVKFGTCTSLMRVLEVDKITKYSSYDREEGESPGIGEYSNPLDFDYFREQMCIKLNEPVRAWKNNNKKVQRIGILTGAGHSSSIIQKAVDESCDTYITGEATLYSIQYAEFVGINLLVGSHTFTELYGVETLVQKIVELNPGIIATELKEAHFELNH